MNCVYYNESEEIKAIEYHGFSFNWFEVDEKDYDLNKETLHIITNFINQ